MKRSGKGVIMSRRWTEKQSYNFVCKLFGMKYAGFNLFLMVAEKTGDTVRIEYIFEKENQFDSIEINVPENSTIPSVKEIFPNGLKMQEEAARRFPVCFGDGEIELQQKPGYSMIEWGPFHPLLSEPVSFKMQTKDEIIDSICIKTGYNFRGIEELCEGMKPADVLEMLERSSLVSGISTGIAYAFAVEEINNIEIPEKAKWIRLILNEMSCFKANLYCLNQTAQCLGLLSDSSEVFRLIDLFNESAEQICDHPQLLGITRIGGVSHDISRGNIYAANAVLQDMKKELNRLKTKWTNTPSIYKRLESTGFIDEKTARQMSGRAARGAGFYEDPRKHSNLPYKLLSYTVPTSRGSNCLSRTMLLIDDLLLSLSLIDQGVENLPEGNAGFNFNIGGSGRAIAREQDAYGGIAVLAAQENGCIKLIKTKNSTTSNFPFLTDVLKGTGLDDLPHVATSINMDLPGMEK